MAEIRRLEQTLLGAVRGDVIPVIESVAWAMKCMERCLSDSAEGKKAVGLACEFARALLSDAEVGRTLEAKDLYRALSEITDLLSHQ